MTWTIQPRSKFGRLDAIISGEGQQVVLIHGVGLRAEAWSKQIINLSKSYKTIAIDIPGHGESSILTDNFKLKEYTDIISESILTPSIIIGHSFGSMIALDLAFNYPEKVKSIISLNSIYKRNQIAKDAVKKRFNNLSKLSNANPSDTLDRWFGKNHIDLRKNCHQWLSSTDPRGYYNAYKVFSNKAGPSNTNLKKLQCPALFITGSKEPNSTPKMSENMSSLTPNGEVKIFDKAAHMLPMTHAKELNLILNEFIMDNS